MWPHDESSQHLRSGNQLPNGRQGRRIAAHCTNSSSHPWDDEILCRWADSVVPRLCFCYFLLVMLDGVLLSMVFKMGQSLSVPLLVLQRGWCKPGRKWVWSWSPTPRQSATSASSRCTLSWWVSGKSLTSVVSATRYQPVHSTAHCCRKEMAHISSISIPVSLSRVH